MGTGAHVHTNKIILKFRASHPMAAGLYVSVSSSHMTPGGSVPKPCRSHQQEWKSEMWSPHLRKERQSAEWWPQRCAGADVAQAFNPSRGSELEANQGCRVKLCLQKDGETGSEVKNAYCSFRGPRLRSQNHMALPATLTPVPGDPISFFKKDLNIYAFIFKYR